MLLRLLFPSWAFFDAVTDVPRLEIRLCPPDGAPAPWQPALRSVPRGVHHLVYNPEGTEALAVQAIVDRFAVECESGLADAVTQALVERVAARAAAQAASAMRVAATGSTATGSTATGSTAASVPWQWRVGAVAASRDDGQAAAYRPLYVSALLDDVPPERLHRAHRERPVTDS